MTTKLAGTFVGAAIALAAGSALADAPAIWTLEVHNGDNAGRAYPGENQRRTNHNQLGAGAEHVRCNLIPNAPGGARVMCMATASYTDIPNSPVTDRIQGLCSSFKVDAQQGLVQTAMKYVTDNVGQDWRNAHAPVVAPAFNGTAAIVLYNYRPNGANNTNLYGKVLGPDCQELTQQTLIFSNQNDNVLGQASDPVVEADAADDTRFGDCGIGNGNGDDANWCLGLEAKKDAAGNVTLSRYFAKIVENEEERSRPSVLLTPIPDTLLQCAAVGNAQPPDRGMRCSLVSTAPNTPNNQRVIWRKYVQQRQGNIYATTPAVASINDASGKPTGKYIVSYVEVDTTNRNGRSKGKTSIKTVPVEVTPTDLNILDTPQYNQVGGGDQAHQAACAGYYGPNAEPVGFIIQGSIVGSTTGVGRLNVLGIDTATNKAVPKDEIVFADSYDTGWISQYYGENPNTPQGRNHGFCMSIDNPGYHVSGGFQPSVKKFLFVANTPRNLRTDGTPQDKLGFDLVLVPTVSDEAGGPNPNPDPTPTPDPMPDPNPTPGDSGAQVGGCQASGAAGAGTILLLGAVFIAIRRRRAV